LDLQHADHPIVTARIIINRGPAKYDRRAAKAVARLTRNGILADLYGLLRGEAPRTVATPVVIATAVLSSTGNKPTAV
jgi:hypothetical protein